MSSGGLIHSSENCLLFPALFQNTGSLVRNHSSSEVKLIMKMSNIIRFYIALLISGYFWVGLNYDYPG